MKRARPAIGLQCTCSPWRERRRAYLQNLCSYSVVHLYDCHADIVPYDVAWSWQKNRVHLLATSSANTTADAQQALVVLQHSPTYTLGTRSSLSNLKFLPDEPPFPLYYTERGGEATYHGPGQLTMYPILDLNHHGKDLHVYLRNLEEVVIRALKLVSGIDAFRIAGLTGVWTSSGKIAAVGVRATRWITYHGIALNVNPNLEHFDHIIPCGISDAEVTSVAKHLQSLQPHAKDALQAMSDSVETARLLCEYSFALQQAFEEVFKVKLTPSQSSEDLWTVSPSKV